ncbi:TRAFAC clade GTPase domain-containing protein [Longimicrobium sp.]|jgi:hypothetical protein|uniref:TRAFAC clade GTPase domain-containing protein n=1 Tax=Longimicrobium sp. TaxID=2029185 RepID=UPI002EDAFC34
MDNIENRFLMLGLPGSGKTTFLAAFWHVVADAEGGRLSAAALPADRRYLNAIRTRWEQGLPAERTLFTADHTASMRVRDQVSGGEADLLFPDLSGEHFERQWTERHCLNSYLDMVRESAGALLFLHPDRVIPPLRLEEVFALAKSLGAPVSAPDARVKPIPFTPSSAATSAQLVDVLQVLADHAPKVSFPLGIVISAWDKVRGIHAPPAPSEWLSRELPLLEQYLRSNDDRFYIRVFGVSAQGWDYPGDDQLLRSTPNPSDRITVVADNEEPHRDITSPVSWLLSTSQARREET